MVGTVKKDGNRARVLRRAWAITSPLAETAAASACSADCYKFRVPAVEGETQVWPVAEKQLPVPQVVMQEETPWQISKGAST